MKKVPDFAIQDVLAGKKRASEVAKEYNVSRQSIWYRTCKFPIKIVQFRQWQVIFLFRIGFTLLEIKEMLGYSTQAIVGMVLRSHGLKYTSVYAKPRTNHRNFNLKWLKQQVDYMHNLVCFGQKGNWHDRVEQMVEQIEKDYALENKSRRI